MLSQVRCSQRMDRCTENEEKQPLMQDLGGKRTGCAGELHTQTEGACMMRMPLAMNEGTSSERHRRGLARSSHTCFSTYNHEDLT